MQTQILIRDELTFRLGQAPQEFVLDLPSNQITIRELIRMRVEQEVARYNQEESELFRGLVQPNAAEQSLNGYRVPKHLVIDAAEQVERALASFETNGFLLLVDNQQVERLDDAVLLQPSTVVTFLKLVPLVGG